jgi:hypothetical protein
MLTSFQLRKQTKKGLMISRNKIAFYIASIGMTMGAFNTQAISLDINSTDISLGGVGRIRFDRGPDTFSFLNARSGNSFVVEGGTDGSGNIAGTFKIGAITIAGGLQSAPVTSSPGAKITITDGTGVFIADIAFGDIFTFGTIGGINSGGSINLSNISYTGSKPNLLALAGDPDGSASIQFGFNPSRSLTDITSGNGSYASTFTGDVSNLDVRVPDGGTTMLLFGVALAGIGALNRPIKR